jgi:hypothetical protein
MLDTRMSTSLFGTTRETRTRTVQGLNLLSLPLEYGGIGAEYWTRTSDPHYVKVVRSLCAKTALGCSSGLEPD